MRPATLSGRERDVASCAATGATTRQIADELFISVRTVESHLGSIYRKLDVSTRAGLVAKLSRNGMLTADDTTTDGPIHGLAPAADFVGRKDEIARLRAAAAASRAGTTRAVLIGGESGVGKSSLLAAALDEIRTDAATSTFVANCFDGISTPFGPVAEALQHHLRGHSGELTEVVGPNGGVLASLLPAMADRLPPVRADLDPAARPRLVVDSFRHTLAHASVRRPVVLVLEDLHWVDQATVAFLRAMITESSDRRVLLVGTFRDTELAMAHPLPGLLADLWNVPSVERINLSGLTLDDASELFARLGGRASAAGAVAGLHEASAGNSLYLSSLLRDVAEGSPSDRLPLSVREAVAQRVARLRSTDGTVLDVAAVAGLDFDLSVVETAAEHLGAIGDDTVLDQAEQASRAGLLAESTKSDADYRFVHDIVRQALLEGISAPRMARIHASVGAAMADISGVDPRAWPLIADHLGGSHVLADRLRAGRYALRTLRSGVAVLAPDEAAMFAQGALDRLPAGPQAGLLRLDLLIELVDVHNLRMDHQAHREAVIEATAVARRFGTSMDVARALAHYRLIPETGSSDTEVLALVDEAIAALPHDDVEAVRLRALLRGYAAYHRSIGGEGFRLGEEAAEALAEARASGDLPTIATVLYNLGGVLLGSPDVARMAAALAEHDRIRHVIPEHVDRHDGIRLLACAALQAGDRVAFDRLRARLAGAADSTQSVFMRSMTVMWNALVALVEGRLEDAAAANDELYGTAVFDPNVLLGWLVQLVAIRVAQGRVDEVLPLVESTTAEHPEIAALRALAAWVLHEAGETARAWEVLEQTAASDFVDLHDDWTLAAALVWSTPVVISSGTEEQAQILADRLLPYTGQLVLVGSATLTLGSADRSIGLLVARLGEVDDGLARLAAAIELEEAVGAPLEAAKSRLVNARVLLDRGTLSDQADAAGLLTAVLQAAEAGGWPHLSQQVTSLLDHP